MYRVTSVAVYRVTSFDQCGVVYVLYRVIVAVLYRGITHRCIVLCRLIIIVVYRVIISSCAIL